MGHNNTPAPSQQYNTALTAATTKSPTEEALQKSALKTLDWADKGDYTDPHGGGLFVNFASPAMLHRNMELQSNEAGQGIEALGVADPNYLATVRENRLAHQDEANAAQYEGDIKEGVGAATAVAGDESRLDLSRKMGVLGTTADLYKSDMNRKHWWDYIAGGISSGATAAAM